MIISPQFIEQLPFSYWQVEIVDNEKYYTLRDHIKCHLFWMELWHKVLAKQFHSQRIIKSIHVNIQQPVFIKASNLDLQVDKTINTINYYHTYSTIDYKPPFPSVSINIYTLFISYTILLFGYAFAKLIFNF